MDPNHNSVTSVPGPSVSTQPAPETSTLSVPPVAPPMPGAVPVAMPGFLPPSVPVGQAGQVEQTAAAAPAGQSIPTVPAAAVDSDLIEKEWVDKAKHIVAQTRNDPYAQTKALHAFKADYMKKRYNKTIGSVEE